MNHHQAANPIISGILHGTPHFGPWVSPQPLWGVPASLPTPSIDEHEVLLAALKAPARPANPGTQPFTLIGLLLDDSGSMSTGQSQTMAGFNRQLDTIQRNAKEVPCEVLQVTFSFGARVMADFASPDKLVRLDHSNYRPMGGTLLYDTAVAAIKKMLSHPRANDENTSLLFALTTDGDDTVSQVWRHQQAADPRFKALMAALSANPRWTVTLTGPDTKLRQFADEMAVPHDNVAAFTPESVGSRTVAMDSSVHAMGNYMATRAAGMMKSEMLYAGTQANVMAKTLLDPSQKA